MQWKIMQFEAGNKNSVRWEKLIFIFKSNYGVNTFVPNRDE